MEHYRKKWIFFFLVKGGCGEQRSTPHQVVFITSLLVELFIDVQLKNTKYSTWWLKRLKLCLLDKLGLGWLKVKWGIDCKGMSKTLKLDPRFVTCFVSSLASLWKGIINTFLTIIWWRLMRFCVWSSWWDARRMHKWAIFQRLAVCFLKLENLPLTTYPSNSWA